jgi:hypothetical protein
MPTPLPLGKEPLGSVGCAGICNVIPLIDITIYRVTKKRELLKNPKNCRNPTKSNKKHAVDHSTDP